MRTGSLTFLRAYNCLVDFVTDLCPESLRFKEVLFFWDREYLLKSTAEPIEF